MNNLKNVFLRGDGKIAYDFLTAYDSNEHGVVIESKITGLLGISKSSDMYSVIENEIKNQKVLNEFENVTYVGKAVQGITPNERMLVLFENSKNYIGISTIPNNDFGCAFNNGNVTIINKNSEFIDHDANLKLTMNEKYLMQKYDTMEKLLRAIENRKSILTPKEIADSTKKAIRLLELFIEKKSDEKTINEIKADLLALKTFERKLQNSQQL